MPTNTNDDFGKFARSVKEKKIGNVANYINKKTNNTTLKSFISSVIQSVTVNYSRGFSPQINGRYSIHMVHGTWLNDDVIKQAKKINVSDTEILKTSSINSLDFPMLATDIDIPEVNKEYSNVSTRSQTLSAYQREITLPEFNISYLEDDNQSIIQYHELWHKVIELSRRGEIHFNNKTNRKKEQQMYFYDVPYSNGVWVVQYDMEFFIRGLFYLVGVRPISLPLKQVIGNRSDSKMTTYNIQYKGTALHYKFFDKGYSFNNNDNSNFIKLFNSTVLSKNKNN